MFTVSIIFVLFRYIRGAFLGEFRYRYGYVKVHYARRVDKI